MRSVKLAFVVGMSLISVLALQSGSLYASNGPGGNAPKPSVTQDRFDEIDIDDNGVVSREEWRGSEDEFKSRDTNRDNVLSRYEFYQELVPDKSLK